MIVTDREQGICEDCACWCPKGTEHTTPKVGECRLHAPLVIVRYDSPQTLWPWTKADDWCCEGSFTLPVKGESNG